MKKSVLFPDHKQVSVLKTSFNPLGTKAGYRLSHSFIYALMGKPEMILVYCMTHSRPDCGVPLSASESKCFTAN